MFKGEKITHINMWSIEGERTFEIVTRYRAHSVSECMAKMVAKHEGFEIRDQSL